MNEHIKTSAGNFQWHLDTQIPLNSDELFQSTDFNLKTGQRDGDAAGFWPKLLNI